MAGLGWEADAALSLLRHPRESGDPEHASADPTLGSRVRGNDELKEKWARVREIRWAVSGAIEPLRRDKLIKSSLEARVEVHCFHDADLELLRSINFAEVCIVEDVKLQKWNVVETTSGDQVVPIADPSGDTSWHDHVDFVRIGVAPTTDHKCGRCWRHLPEVAEDGALCNRCETVLDA